MLLAPTDNSGTQEGSRQKARDTLINLWILCCVFPMAYLVSIFPYLHSPYACQ